MREVPKIPWSRFKVGDTCKVIRDHKFDPLWSVDPLRRDVNREVEAANKRNPTKHFTFTSDGDDFIITRES